MYSGFFEDTDVYAEDFARFAAGILSNGILADDSNTLKVTAGSGMAINVAPGYCWINGHFGKCEYEETFEVSPSDGTYGRYDRVVARLDASSKKISIFVRKGTPSESPEIPKVLRDGTFYDLGLAVIYVRAGALTISNSDITDTRNDSVVCGAVTARTADKLALDGKADKSELETLATVGDIKMTACTSAPKKWLICDGAAVSRTKYADLFSAIGTTYGEGNGSTTFNLPNLKGKVVVGVDSGDERFSAIGQTGGEKEHTLTVDEMPTHSHTAYKAVNAPGDISGISSEGRGTGTLSGTISTSEVGSGTAHNNLQPYMALNYIIFTGVA